VLDPAVLDRGEGHRQVGAAGAVELAGRQGDLRDQPVGRQRDRFAGAPERGM
jgi:hypothetical protein